MNKRDFLAELAGEIVNSIVTALESQSRAFGLTEEQPATNEEEAL
jgi:hypothetical protein